MFEKAAEKYREKKNAIAGSPDLNALDSISKASKFAEPAASSKNGTMFQAAVQRRKEEELKSQANQYILRRDAPSVISNIHNRENQESQTVANLSDIRERMENAAPQQYSAADIYGVQKTNEDIKQGYDEYLSQYPEYAAERSEGSSPSADALKIKRDETRRKLAELAGEMYPLDTVLSGKSYAAGLMPEAVGKSNSLYAAEYASGEVGKELETASVNEKNLAARSEEKKAYDAQINALLAQIEQNGAEYYSAGAKALRSLSAEDMKTVSDYLSSEGIFSKNEALVSSGAPEERAYTAYGEEERRMRQLMQKLRGDGWSDDEISRMTETARAMLNFKTAAKQSDMLESAANTSPAIASVFSIFTNLVGALPAGVDIVAQGVRTLAQTGRDAEYKRPFDAYSEGIAGVRATNTIRGAVSEKIASGDAGELGSFLYQTVMSGTDSLLSAFLGGSATYAVFFSNAAAGATLDAKERGVSDERALIYGMLSGAAEVFFEQFSIGDMQALKEVPTATLKDFFRNMLTSVGVNASEEAATEIANVFSDYFVNGDKSSYALAVQSYMADGYSEAEAKERAIWDIAGQIGLAGAGGALMGGMNTALLGGYNYASGANQNRSFGNLYLDENGRVNASDANALIGEGLASADDAIVDYAAKLARKNSLDSRELGLLTRMLEQQKSNEAVDYDAEVQSGYADMEEYANRDSQSEFPADIQDRILRANEQEAQKSPALRKLATDESAMQVFDGVDVPSSSMQFMAAENYTSERRKTIRDYLQAVNSELSAFVERVKRGEKTRPWFNLGGVNARAAADVQSLTGVDVSGYVSSITPSDVRHILRRHGENGVADHSMRDVNDLARIEFVMQNYDDVELQNDTTLAVTNTDQSPASLVKFSKKIDGTYYVVEAVPDSNAKKMRVITAYISAKGASHAAANAEAFDRTPEAHLPYSADTYNIAQAEGESQEGGGNLQLHALAAEMAAERDEISTAEKMAGDVKAFAEKLGSAGRDVFVSMYSSDMDSAAYLEAMTVYYNAGKNGTDMDRVKGNADALRILNSQMKKAAYLAGKSDAALEQKALALETNSGYTGNTYDAVERALQTQNRYDADEYTFQLIQSDGGWMARIDTADADGIHTQTGAFPTRDAAVSAIVNQAKSRGIFKSENGGIVNDGGRTQQIDAGDIWPQNDQRGTRTSERSRGKNEEVSIDSITERYAGRRLTQQQSEIGASFGERPVIRALADQTVTPESQSFTAKEQQKAIGYGVPSFVIPDTVYDRFRGDKKQRYAFSYSGQIYLREHIPETYQNVAIAEHEATHVMRQIGYAPYMDFLQRTPDMINFHSAHTKAIVKMISAHTGVDILNATPKQLEKFYDEINAGMYGHIAKGQVEELRAVYGDAFKDFDAYVRELTDIHEQFKHRNQQKTPNDAEEIQHAVSADETRTGEWTAERVGDRNKNPKPLSEIVEKIRHDFGIQITTGHIRGAGVLGQYNRRSKGIRSRKANDLPTIAHELGHHLDNLYGLREKISGAARDELINGLSNEMRLSYPKRLWLTEGIAEYIRKFLQNSSQAAIEYPKFTEFFKKSLSPKDLALIEQLADEVNAYFSLDTDTATSSIRLREDKSPDARTYGEKIKDISDAMYQSWTDTLHGIKRFDEAIGADTYKIATNSAYADAIAGEIITGDLTDANGRFVSGGLKEALHGINLQDKNEYLLFGEYLTVRHGPERRKENMHVFADDTKNDESFMNQRRAELEAAYPRFAEAAERLYRFQKQFLQTWGVDTGLVSQESADAWAERWKYYVPLNRAIPKSRFGGVKRGFANQNSTIHHAKGSGLDIIHPVDNIIANIAKMVTAGVRNNVMRLITDSAIRLGGNADFMEQAPPPVKVTNVNMTGVKEKLNDKIFSADLDASGKEVMFGIVAGIDDVLTQYGKGKAQGDTVTVLKNGKPEYWKINDPLLLESLVNMAPTQMNGILDAYAVVSRFMTSNITGNNLIWSIFSNFPRDMMTFFTYSKEKNPIKVFAAFGSAYVNKIKGDRADPLYKEFLAMGGGNMSAYSADRDLTKKARAKLIGKRSYNPLDLIAFVGDLIESGPRFATYRLMRQNGMTPQEAFYEAMDITVNFRRGGIYSRQLNQAVPFFNANVQGLDKFQRWITAEEAPRGKARLKAIRSRMIQYIVVSAALAALIYGLNNSDDDKEKDYEQLSNYTKNSYWNIPLGDGKYFAIPKPREIGVLSSFFETCMEYGIGKNDHAFDEFYDYAVGNFLPSIASDLAIGDWRGALGSFGIFGVGFYMGGNRDFLGKPIESAGMQNLEPKSRYTDRTSKIAYWVGQAFNTSPVMIDYFFTQTLGGWWKAQKALFPVGHESADYTLGVRNTYIKDNQYSTDLVNWMYDKAEQSKQKHNSAPEDAEKAITYKLDSVMTDFYSKYYSLAKSTNANGTAERGTRQVVLDMIHEYQKADDSGYLTDVQKAVYDVCKKDFEKEGEFNLLPAVMNTYVKDGADKIHNLDAVQYVEYQTDYLRLYWEIVEETLGEAKTQEARAAILKSAKTVAKEQATNRTLARIGANLTSYHDDFRGVDDEDVVRFKAALELAGLDGSLTQEEVENIIKEMEEEQKIIDGAMAYMLFHSKYESDKNNPWKRYKPDWVE